MGSNEVLNQDEINALLSDDSDESDDDFNSELIEDYDFTVQNRVSKFQFPCLELINQEFANNFSGELFDFLKKEAEVVSYDLKVLKYEEYMNMLSLPTSINLVSFDSLKGEAMITLDDKILFLTVDSFFGGSGKVSGYRENKLFSPSEKRVISIMLEKLFKSYSKAWEVFFPINIELLHSEINPALVTGIDLSQTVIISSFRCDIEGGGGEIHFVIPYPLLIPIKSILSQENNKDITTPDPAWQEAIRKELLLTSVEVSASLCEKSLTLREITELKVGDVLPIDLPDKIVMKADTVPAYYCRFGEINGHMALKVQDKIKGDNKVNSGDTL